MASQIVVGTNASAPSTPASGTVAVYPKTDNKLYIKDATGVEVQVGSGSGTGSGVDAVFIEADQVMTKSYTIGSSTYADGAIFTGGSSVIAIAVHNFVVDSLIHFRAGSGGALPPEVVYDTVYRVIAPVVAGVSITMVNATTGATITPSTAGTAPNQVGKIKNAIITNPFYQAAGVVLTVEAGTVVTQA